MAFPLKDVRFSTRRNGDGLTLYPRLLRDRAVLPKIDIAIQYFESMLGCQRRELDTEVLVHFFGDHKLARCMVACLARGYRFHSPRMAEVVTLTALRRLERAGLDEPPALRLALYDYLNDADNGFLDSEWREERVGEWEKRLRLRQGELERLLYLDADEHMILTRVGSQPNPLDVMSQFNFRVLESLLRHAESVELRFAELSSEARSGVLALCRINEVDASLSTDRTPRLRLNGRTDSLGVWARHGRRIARTVVQILERARPSVAGGEARVAIRDRRATLRLTEEALDLLTGVHAPPAGWGALEGWTPESVARAAAAGRWARSGLRLRRTPDPQAWAAGIAVPELQLSSDSWRASVCIVESPEHGLRLAPIATTARTGDDLVFVGDPRTLAPLVAAGGHTIAQVRFDPSALGAALHALLDPPASANSRVA
jgi:predicted nuclease of restriction endonuclease-like RecB superfamily